MNLEQKMGLIAQSIADAFEMTPKGEHTLLLSVSPSIKEIPSDEIRRILRKFEESGYLKITNILQYQYKDEAEFELEILDLGAIRAIKSPESEARKHNIVNQNQFYIVFNDDRRIMLNGKIELAKPDFDGINELVFRFLYENPNKPFTKQEIETQLRLQEHIAQKWDKIVENLGFRRGLKSSFFDIKGDTIQFKNPVSL